jgi:hypothetical protein
LPVSPRSVCIHQIKRDFIHLPACSTSPSRYLAYLTNWGIWSTILHLSVDAIIGMCIWSYYRRHQSDSTHQQYPKHVRDPFAADSGPELYLDVTPGRWTQHVYRLSLLMFEIR